MLPCGMTRTEQEIPIMMQFAILLIPIALLTACAASPDESGTRLSPRVELLGFDACPNTPTMHERLRQALDEVDRDVVIEIVDQELLDEDDLRRGYPAPTVLVNGRDLWRRPVPESSGIGCRVYRGPGGLPSVDELKRRLTAAVTGKAQQ